MITITDLPERSVEAARLAMAEALAHDGDGIPECIVAAINAWDGALVERGARCDAVVLPFNRDADIGVILFPGRNGR